MAHIHLNKKLRGIRALFDFRRETAEPLCQLADVMLRQANSLSRAERELIATYVSSLNDCRYYRTAHGAIAAYQLDENESIESYKPRAAAVAEGGYNQIPSDMRSRPVTAAG